MRNIAAVFIKQIKDTIKNGAILVQFFMLPVIAFIMEHSVTLEGMPEHFFVRLFSVMYCAMAPLICMSSIISEEKEKNTLRVLLLSDVKPWEYLAGVGGYLWLICMLGAGVFCLTGGFTGKQAVSFMLIMAAGILISMLFGAALGTWSRNQMMATSLTIPVMLIFSFFPMLSMFNKTIEQVAKFTYSQQIQYLIDSIGHIEFHLEDAIILLANILIAFFLFWSAYRRCGLA